MSMPEVYQNLINALEDKTLNGQLKWNNDDGENFDSIYSSFIGEGNIVKIWSGVDETGREYVSFSLHNELGYRLDSWYVDEGERGFNQMKNLYDTVRRNANGVLETLHNLEVILSKP